jgi:hypothetical protein
VARATARPVRARGQHPAEEGEQVHRAVRAIGVYLDGAGGREGKIMLVYTDGGDTRSSIAFHGSLDLLRPPM